MTEEQKKSETKSPEMEIIEDLTVKVTLLTNELIHTKKTANAANAMAIKVDELCSGKTIERAKADAKSIHNLYQLTHLKMTVATELSFLARDKKITKIDPISILQKVTLAFDYPDSWWQKRANQTLAYWMDAISEIKVNDSESNTLNALINKVA